MSSCGCVDIKWTRDLWDAEAAPASRLSGDFRQVPVSRWFAFPASGRRIIGVMLYPWNALTETQGTHCVTDRSFFIQYTPADRCTPADSTCFTCPEVPCVWQVRHLQTFSVTPSIYPAHMISERANTRFRILITPERWRELNIHITIAWPFVSAQITVPGNPSKLFNQILKNVNKAFYSKIFRVTTAGITFGHLPMYTWSEIGVIKTDLFKSYRTFLPLKSRTSHIWEVNQQQNSSWK